MPLRDTLLPLRGERPFEDPDFERNCKRLAARVQSLIWGFQQVYDLHGHAPVITPDGKLDERQQHLRDLAMVTLNVIAADMRELYEAAEDTIESDAKAGDTVGDAMVARAEDVEGGFDPRSYDALSFAKIVDGTVEIPAAAAIDILTELEAGTLAKAADRVRRRANVDFKPD